MREDNDRMNAITRTESDDAMKPLLTKEDFDEAKAEISATIAASMADTKSGIVASIDNSLTKAWLDNREHTTRRITEAKLEILSENKKNIADAIAPLNRRLDLVDARLDRMDGRLDQMDGRFDQIDGRFDRMDGRLDQMDGRFDQMDGRFDRMDGRLDQMDGRFDRMNGRLDQMDGRLDRMDGRLDQMDGRFDRMDGRLDQMDGRLDQMDGRLDRMDEELRKLGDGQVAIAKNVDTIARFAQLVLDEHENRLKDAKL